MPIWLLPLYGQEDIQFSDGSEAMQNEAAAFFRDGIDSARVDAFRRTLIDNGYIDSRLILHDSAGAKTVTVSFGRLYKIGRIYINGDVHDTLDINANFDAYEADNPLDSVIESFQERGYYYAGITPREYLAHDGFLDIKMSFLIGPVVTVSSLNYAGLIRTDRNLLRHYVRISEGDTIKPGTMAEIKRNLDEAEFISLAAEPRIVPDPGYRTGQISIEFNEIRQFRFEGSGGYVPDDDGYFLWYINTRMRNIFGGGRDIGLMVDRREKNKATFSVDYAQPVFMLGMDKAGLGLATRDYRDQFYEFSVESFYDTRLNRNLTATIALGWKNVEPEDDTTASHEVYSAGFGVRAGSEKRINTINGGVAVRWRIDYNSRRYKNSGGLAESGRTVYNDTRNVLTVQASRRWFGPVAGYARFVLKDIASSEKPIPLSEQFFFGGPGSLRGYRNDQFAAQRLFIISPELRWFYSKAGYFYSFYNAAWYESYRAGVGDMIEKFDDIVSGFGLGINLQSGERLLKIEFSWGEGDAVDEPRLNVVIGGEF